MPTFYPPGKRRNNRFCVVKGRIDGREYEIRTTARYKRDAKRDWNKFAEKVRSRRYYAGTPRTFAELAERYCEGKCPSPNDRRYIMKLVAVLGNVDAADLRQADFQTAARLLYRSATPQTRNRQALVPSAAIIHWAAESWPETFRYFVVKKEKEPKPESRTPAPGVRELLLANADGDLHDMLLFLFAQGWRIAEACALTWDAVDLPARELRIFIPKAREWKSMAMRGATFEMLASRPAVRKGRVFPWRTPRAFYKPLRKLTRRLGVAFTPRMARHAFATEIADHHVPERGIKAAGTWTCEKSVARYTTAGVQHAHEVMDLLDGKSWQKQGRGT